MNIRNFSITAHIDHGKSTLADRMLEITNTVSARDMQGQILDQMDLERERGITIKMQPVQLKHKVGDEEYILNLIDTPGHTDFSYEVSRAMKAVEGAILLVDSTQGVEAQTFSVLEEARLSNLVIIPVLSKTDMPYSRVEDIAAEIVDLLGCKREDILQTSGKTGEGVKELLDAIVKRIPPPTKSIESEKAKGMIFDFSYSSHTGVIAHTRVFSGEFRKGDYCTLLGVNKSIQAKEVGFFGPTMTKSDSLQEGTIGYIVTGLKEPGLAVVGDTIVNSKDDVDALPGYTKVEPVVWASIFPREGDKFPELLRSLKELHLRDASIVFEEERSEILGKGFRCGFLGMLHLEIITEQIRRDFSVEIITTSPSTDYKVIDKAGKNILVSNPSLFPEKHEYISVEEPWVAIEIMSPEDKLGNVVKVVNEFSGLILSTERFSKDRLLIKGEMALREMFRGFFDTLKNVTSGYASFSYVRTDYRAADIARLDVLIGDELFPAFSKIVARSKVDRESRKLADIIHKHLPRQMFTVKIQVKSDGRIIASNTLSGMKKDVTAKLYGGDITRKMKLREKQKKGKKKMQGLGTVRVPNDVFLKVVKMNDN